LWFAAVLRTTLADAGQDGWGAAAMASSAVLGGLFLLLIAVGAALAYSIAGSGNRYLGLTPLATEKMACFLLESAVQRQETPKGIRFNLTLTHEEIAQVVGVTPETVTRALTELRTKMLISTIGPSVLIRNKPALEAMVVA
jgi:CRP-like cAMP-binding protein